MSFEVIPAIDILNGKCVRLEKGDYNKLRVYSEDPLDIAKRFENDGYKRIHIVDLDGARSGEPKNLEIIKKIASIVSIPIQVGGGIRTLDTIMELIDNGINRIIFGTIAFENLNLLETAIKLYDKNVVVSIDAKNDVVLTKGWLKTTNLDAISLANKLTKIGIKRFIYTDIDKDGMLQGPNYSGIKRFASSVDAKVIASGGISTQEDIDKLAKLSINIEGCIVGKAIYEGKIKPN